MPDSSIRIILNSFYLLISSFEKFATWIWHLPFAMYLILNRENTANTRGKTPKRRPKKKENPPPPPPPPPPKKNQRWETARLCPSRGFILDWRGRGGDGGLLFHFSLSKTVGSITSRCSGIRAVTGKIKDRTQGQQKSSLENFFFTLKTVSNCVTGEDI